MRVIRWCIFDPITKQCAGDFLSVDGVQYDLRKAGDLEYQRAKRDHPQNPAFFMRPMFRTGSPYADEIIAIFKGGNA